MAVEPTANPELEGNEPPLDLVVELGAKGRVEQAESVARRALALKPDDAELHFGLGNLLMRQGKTDEAVAHYIRATALKPDYAEAYHNLGNALSYRHHFGTAIAACRKAIALKPDYPRALADLVHFRMHACDWPGIEGDIERVLAAARSQPREIAPFTLLNLPASPADQLLCARERGARFSAANRRSFSHARPPARGKLRVGYLSADFRAHAMANLIVELIERHDRSAFEVTGYSIGPDDQSAMRARLVTAFDRFVDLRALDDAEAAQRIHSDQIDILIDITGYTRYGRTRLLASRPAPIQVNLPGFPGTLGADFIDYIIADEFVSPADQQPFYTEKLVHLPNCYQPNDTRREVAERTPTRRECGLPPEGVVICCFNSPYKILPNVFDAWMQIIRAVPGSVLWLYETNPLAKENLGREAAARGVEPKRLVFAPWRPNAEHLARYRLADLSLDTLPYNGHTTGSDALWMGLPVLTCAGSTFAGRVGGSLLRSVGLQDLIAASLEDYVAIGTRLARTPGLLSGLRKQLTDRLATAGLFDMARYARDIEAAYRKMLEIWLSGETPRQIDFRTGSED